MARQEKNQVTKIDFECVFYFLTDATLIDCIFAILEPDVKGCSHLMAGFHPVVNHTVPQCVTVWQRRSCQCRKMQDHNSGITLRWRYTTHVGSRRSFAAGKTRETSFTLLGKVAETWRLIDLYQRKTDRQKATDCTDWMLRSVTHLASISSIISTLTFVTLRKRKIKYRRENERESTWSNKKWTIRISERPQVRGCPTEDQPVEESSPCSPCVLFHPARNTHDIGESWFIQGRTWKCNILFAWSVCTFSPLEPRSPWKQKIHTWLLSSD